MRLLLSAHGFSVFLPFSHAWNRTSIKALTIVSLFFDSFLFFFSGFFIFFSKSANADRIMPIFLIASEIKRQKAAHPPERKHLRCLVRVMHGCLSNSGSSVVYP